jgi:dihydrofolate reductase
MALPTARECALAEQEGIPMGKVVVFTNLTLDGVMQAPARPDEDRRGGFEHGAWATPYAAMQQAGGGLASDPALLFGRRTYEDFYEVWPKRKDSPFSAMLDSMQKYVASRTLTEPLPWKNSTLLQGDAAEAVSELKAGRSKDLLILGSGALVQSLMLRNIVDEYVLLIHPLVLGSGRRLFTEGGSFSALHLVNTRTTDSGVVIATYRPAEPADTPMQHKTAGAMMSGRG